MRSTWTSRFKPGDTVPAFKATLQDNTVISSDALKGRPYVLFFYNHDGSETCTKQTCAVRDEYPALKKLGYTVYGVSEDSAKKHIAFIAKFNLPFPLIVDTDNMLAKAFDIFGTKKFMGKISDAVHRTAFVIDEQGKFQAVIHPVDAAHHGRQILDTIKAATS